MGISQDLVYDNLSSAQAENAKCAICTDLLLDPVVLRECEHHFCRECLDRWIERLEERHDEEDDMEEEFIPTCPECRATFTDSDKQGYQADGVGK